MNFPDNHFYCDDLKLDQLFEVCHCKKKWQ